MHTEHLPPGLELEATDAIRALAACEGLHPTHIKTIQFCFACYSSAFLQAYARFFEHRSFHPLQAFPHQAHVNAGIQT